MACYTPGNLINQNLASCYRPDQQAATPPDFSFFQLDDSTVQVDVRINAEHLLFSRQENGSFKAFCAVHIELVRAYESPAVLDSGSYLQEIRMDERTTYNLFSFRMKVHASGELLAKVRLTDMNRGSSEERFARFRMSGPSGRNSFLVLKNNDDPLFEDRVTVQDSFHIIHRDHSMRTVQVRYFHREFPLSAPPFGVDNRTPFDYRPDSVFVLEIGRGVYHRFEKLGFYHLQVDTTGKEGLTIFVYEEGFPKVVNTVSMLEPVRFLTTRSEYDAMNSAPSLRKAMDEFWLERCKGSREKSRLLIQRYYQRVQWANKLFSSYMEGWRTDRGMLYIMMGAPNTVFRASNSETWVYGTVNSPTALNFMFVKVDNPFTDNDFSLTRSPIYENPWYRAVDTWRQGRAYNTID